VNTVKLALCLCVVTTGLLAARAPAHAQAIDAPNIAGGDDMPWNRGVDAETRSAARAIFLEGNRLFKIPLFSQAVEKYNEALAKWQHPAFHFNLALTEINLGQYLEARDSLLRAVQYGPAPLRQDRYDEAKKQLVEVEKHLGRVRVTCDIPGVEVTLDGAKVLIGPGERVAWVVPRAHDLTATKSAYRAQEVHVTVAAGATENVAMSPHKLIEDRPWAVWKPWAVVMTGAAIVAAGGVFHALSAHEFAQYDDGFSRLTCAALGCTEMQIRDPNQNGSPQLGARLDRARLEQRIAVGSYVAGGAAIAAGVYLVYRNQPHITEQDGPPPGEPRGVAVTPVVAPDMLGVLVTMRR
jgi:hypothetical protein